MTTQRIRQHISTLPLGTPFSVGMFLSMGSRAAVDQALSRLVQAGTITRVTRGVFVRPRENFYLGKLAPEPASVAKLLAAESGAVLEVHGAEAARRFGRSTQMPTQAVYYTSGPTRRRRLGKLQVTMKHVSPRYMKLAGTQAGAALSAFRYLGKRQVTQEVVRAVKAKLAPAEFERLVSAPEAMPGWLAAAVRAQAEPARHG